MLLHKVDAVTGRNLIYWACLSKDSMKLLYKWLDWGILERFRGEI